MPLLILIGGLLGLAAGTFLACSAAAGIAAALGPLLPGLVAGGLPSWAAALAPLPPLLAALAHVAAVVVLYWVAWTGLGFGIPANGAQAPAWYELLCRGGLIGLNSAANAVLWLIILLPGHTLAALWVLVVNFGAAVPGVFPRLGYQAALGYSGWLMPMAWPGQVLGLLGLLVDLVALALGASLRLRFEPFTGTLIFQGWLPPPPFRPTGWNLANFVFFPNGLPPASPWLPAPVIPTPTPPGRLPYDFTTALGITFHETGHTVSIAAFGWIFGLNNFVDQLINGPTAYAEMLAEGHQLAPDRPWIRHWANVVPADVTPSLVVAPFPTSAAVGDVLTLDASASDDGGDSFPMAAVSPGVTPSVGFLWVTAARPPGSTAEPLTPIAGSTPFVPDVGGDYWISVGVTDGATGRQLLTDAATSPFGSVTAGRLLSVVGADANGDYTGTSGLTLSAAGSDAGSLGRLPSLAAPGDPVLQLQWAITGGPAGAALSDPSAEAPVFTGPPGDYEVRLTVTALDGATPVSHADVAGVSIT